MIQTMKAKVTGMKRFKGDVEGKHYDSTTVYVETRLYDKAGNRRGYASQDYPCGEHLMFHARRKNRTARRIQKSTWKP